MNFGENSEKTRCFNDNVDGTNFKIQFRHRLSFSWEPTQTLLRVSQDVTIIMTLSQNTRNTMFYSIT